MAAFTDGVTPSGSKARSFVDRFFDGSATREARKAAAVLAVGVGLILSLSLGTRVLARLLRSGTEAEGLDSVAQFFSVDGERNVPATLSGLLFVATAGLCLAAATRAQGRNRLAWAFFGTTTLAMAFDELFEIHERLLKWVGEGLGFESGGLIYFVWVIPGAMLVVAMVAVAFWLTKGLDRWQRAGALVAAAVFFGGALGVETVTGVLFDDGGSSLLYVLLQIVEEGMEFTGVSLMFLVGLESFLRLSRGQSVTSPEVRSSSRASLSRSLG